MVNLYRDSEGARKIPREWPTVKGPNALPVVLEMVIVDSIK